MLTSPSQHINEAHAQGRAHSEHAAQRPQAFLTDNRRSVHPPPISPPHLAHTEPRKDPALKRTTKIATAVAMTLPIALIMSGCSSDGGDNGGGDGDDNTLTVWAWDPAFNIYALEEAEKIYQKDHPDFKLDIVETPWDDLQPKLTTLAQSQPVRRASRHLPDAEQRIPEERDQLPGPLQRVSGDCGRLLAVPRRPSPPTRPSTAPTTACRSTRAPPSRRSAPTCSRRPATRSTTSPTSRGPSTSRRRKDVLAKTGKPLLSGQAGSADTIMMMLQSRRREPVRR